MITSEITQETLKNLAPSLEILLGFFLGIALIVLAVVIVKKIYGWFHDKATDADNLPGRHKKKRRKR